jgi:hypothetical protein
MPSRSIDDARRNSPNKPTFFTPPERITFMKCPNSRPLRGINHLEVTLQNFQTQDRWPLGPGYDQPVPPGQSQSPTEASQNYLSAYGSSSWVPGSQSFVTKVIESPLGSESTIFVTGFAGSVSSSFCRLLLLVGAIAKAKARAGTLPCSKT